MILVTCQIMQDFLTCFFDDSALSGIRQQIADFMMSEVINPYDELHYRNPRL